MEEEKKKVTTEDLKKLGVDYIKESNAPGTWDDLKKERTELKEDVFYVHGKYYPVQYRDLGWGERNQITENLARSLGNNPNPMIYQREMQKSVIERRVVYIAGHKMQNDQGEPLAKEWHSLPASIGEYLRAAFFSNTGEVCNQIVEGTPYTSIEQLKQVIDQLVVKKDEQADGIQTQDEVALKN